MNLKLLIVSVLVIILGYSIIALDRKPCGFGIFGLTIGPLVLLMGFIIVFFAIFWKKNQ